MTALEHAASCAVAVMLLCAAAPLTAQHAAAPLTAQHAPLAPAASAPRLAPAAPIYSLPLPGQPLALRARGTAYSAVSPLQRREYVDPTKYIVGGTAVGAFAGALAGYVNCVASDRDCSFLWRFLAGSGIGSALGAALWLGTVPQS